MYILDVKIDNISKKQVLDKIRQLLTSNSTAKPATTHTKRGEQLCTTNPEFVLQAQDDKEFKNIINNSWLSVADGYGIKLAAKYLNLIGERKSVILNFLTGMKIAFWGFIKSKKLDTLKDIITGSDLVSEISEICAQENKKIFLLGGFKNVPELTAEYLSKKYNLKIFNESNDFNEFNGCVAYSIFETENIIEKINNFAPDVLFVALHYPRALKWIDQNLEKMPSVKLAIGVGGSFDYLSKKIKRAPMSWRYSYEWLFRLFKQPQRLKRIWNAWIIFSWRVFIKSL